MKLISVRYRLFLFIIISVLIIFNLCLGIFLFGMRKIDSYNNLKTVEFSIKSGTSVNSILDLLKDKGLIRSKLFSKIYIKLNNFNMQAGVYDLNTNMNSFRIINMIANGEVTDKYKVILTFKEGKNIKQYAKLISEKTNNNEEDVYNLLKDDEYIDSLIEKYWFLTEDIKNSGIYYPLEGYLFPETYFFENKDVTVKEIFTTMLNQTNKILSVYKSEIESKDLSIHEFMTLASIVELEGLYDLDRSMIAGVFYNRLESGDRLGSDVTTYYAVGKDMGENPVLTQADIEFNSPYNTRLANMAGKLPIGPIGNSGEASIRAAIEPTDSSYYYFVANCKTGKTVFSKTFNEHVNAVEEIRASGCEF